MASEKILSTSKIIWCDPSVTNKENRSYIKALTDLKYSLENFHSSEDTANFLKANPLRKYIIITAGSTGHDLLQRIESLNNIIGVVVFCYEKAKHLKWAKNYQQVKNVTTSITELVEEVNKISKNFLLLGALETATGSDYEITKEILNGNDISGTTEMAEYFHFKTEKVMDFKLTSILLKVSPTPSEVLEELLAFKTSPDSEKEIKIIFQDYEQPSFNLLKAFCYLYSTDLIYSQFTRACASKSYMKVIKTIKATLNKLRDQPTRVFRNNNTKLYRGVKKAWITPEDYKDKKGFWPSFTSTSQDEAIAKKFAGPQGIIFVISLSEQSTHPNIIIDEGWSKFPIEKEVLLLPYFPLKTTSITEKDGYTYIHVKQNEEDSVLSLENDDLWPLKIELGIYIGLEEKFYEIYESFCSALTIESIVGNMSFAMAVLEVAVNEIKQAHESELSNNLLLRLSNSSEDIYKNLEERVSNRLKDTIPEIIKRHIEERICSLYEQTNSQIDKIVAEEALGTQDLHTQLNDRLLKGLTEVLNTWITLKKEITVKGMLNPLASVLATEIVKEIAAGNIIELDSVNVISIFSKTLKSDKIKLKPEVNSVLQEICTKKQECYTHIDQCNQELFNEYKRILDDIKLMLKKRIKHLIFEAN